MTALIYFIFFKIYFMIYSLNNIYLKYVQVHLETS